MKGRPSPASLGAIRATRSGGPARTAGIDLLHESALAEALGVAMVMTDAEGWLTFYNSAAARLWGWHPPLGSQRWCGAWRLLAADGGTLPHDRCATAICLREGQPVRGAWAYAERPDGSRLPIACFPTPLRDAAGHLTGALTILLDISGLHPAETAPAVNEQRFHAAQEVSPEGFITARPLRGSDGTVTDFVVDYANPAAARLFARERHEMEGRTMRGLLGAHPRATEVIRGYAAVHATGEPLRREAAYRVAGRRIWVRSRTVRLGDGIAIACDDITERRQAESHMRHLALHDALTGLPNRIALQKRLAVTARAGTGLAVLALGLDDFHVANHALGHATGDALLRGVAERLRACLPPGAFLARLDGDEFAVLLTGAGLRDRAEVLAQRLQGTLARPFLLGGYRASLGLAIGIALVAAGSGPAPGPEEVLQQADLALVRTRAEGGRGWRFFAPELAAEMEQRVSLRDELRQALATGAVALHYQPIIDLAQDRPNGFEALLRWSHPRRGSIRPCEFVPVAEETGLILPLGEWALRRACADAASWSPTMKVSVNLSPVQFLGSDMVQVVAAALEAAELPPCRLELEITESVLLQRNEAVLASLRALRAMGVRIALDDFGTGYASLSYLRAFSFDKIKIDQSFVRDAVTRPDCLAIVRSVANLAADLGMTATAEGVEGAEHLAMVRGVGCAEAQGFHLGRPMPAEALGPLLGR